MVSEWSTRRDRGNSDGTRRRREVPRRTRRVHEMHRCRHMRSHGTVIVGILAALGACEGRPETKPEPAPPPAAKAPKRTAVADHDLRVMLTDLAAEKACTM